MGNTSVGPRAFSILSFSPYLKNFLNFCPTNAKFENKVWKNAWKQNKVWNLSKNAFHKDKHFYLEEKSTDASCIVYISTIYPSTYNWDPCGCNSWKLNEEGWGDMIFSVDLCTSFLRLSKTCSCTLRNPCNLFTWTLPTFEKFSSIFTGTSDFRARRTKHTYVWRGTWSA